MDNKLSRAGWLAIVILIGLLAAAIVYAVHAWQAMAAVPMSGWGWTFLALGIVVMVAVGAGLMGLVFYSSRHGMDR